jgi:hypothetical protein
LEAIQKKIAILEKKKSTTSKKPSGAPEATPVAKIEEEDY